MSVRLASLRGGILLALVVVVIGALTLAFADNSTARVVNIFLINLMVTVGLQVTMGNSNVASLGHASFMGIGAYAASVLAIPVAIKATIIPDAPFGIAEFALGVFPAALVGIAVATLFAFLSGLVLTRQAGIAATIATLAWLVIVHVVLVNWIDLTRGPRAIYGIPVVMNTGWLMALAAGIIVIARLFRDSRMGVQLRASGEDILAAGAMGVNVRLLRLAAWTLSGAIIGAAGVFYAFFLGTIAPRAFYFDPVFLTLAMLILGGMRSVSGAVSGAIIVTIGFEAMRWLENGPTVFGLELPQMLGLTGFFLGVIIVLFMALRRSGIVGDEEFDEILARRKRERMTATPEG